MPRARYSPMDFDLSPRALPSLRSAASPRRNAPAHARESGVAAAFGRRDTRAEQHTDIVFRRVPLVATKIRPVGDRVVVKPAQKEEVTRSGIVIPDTAKEKPQEGTVIAVGAGKLTDNGDRQPLEVKEGDRVLFAKYGGTEFKLDGEDLLVLRESDILAILQGEK
jgi:chaperonin GroES